MTELYDLTEIMMEDTEEDFLPGSCCSVSDALVRCLNEKMAVDIGYISKISGETAQNVISALKGVVFQEPEEFENRSEYDAYEGWVLAESYLCGNIQNKIKTAVEVNRRFGGKFESNIEALERILPECVDLEDIHLSLGATWIPPFEITLFIKDFLNLKEEPEVHFYKDLGLWKVEEPKEAKKSVLNTITFGVIEDGGYAETRKQYLTAIDIIEQTLNAKTVKVVDYEMKRGSVWGTYEYEPVLNREKSLEAREKQQAIIDAFKDWVYSSKVRAERFEGYYNDNYVGYCFSAYDGSFLELPGLNKDITLYKHQRDVIARILLSRENILLAHDVGTGKTYEMVVAVSELYRLGISRKNMVVVPNNILESVVSAHRLLYGNDKIFAVYPKEFTPDRRNEILEEIRDGDYTAVYMAYSSFDMITMSKDYYIKKMTEEVRMLRAAASNATSKQEKREYHMRADKCSKKLSEYLLEEEESLWLNFDALGIETLIVDEAHNYKNIPIKTKTNGIVGMGGKNGSKKCREMLEKAHYCNRIIFATGTPLTNSLADLYTFQTYLQPQVLKYHNIDTFDTWISTFGQRETSIECDVDANANSLRTMTRFSSFNNLSELMSIFSQCCDFYHQPENEEGMPDFDGPTDIIVPKNPFQAEYIRNLSERTEKIRAKGVKRNEDNLLKVTVDGRKAALDIRMIKDMGDSNITEKTKIRACAEKVYEIYTQPGTVQIVFSDIGIPKDEFNVYDEVRRECMRFGIPAAEIAFVHDATTERARAKLFSDMNKGRIRIAIGSTQKLGVGVNVQEHLAAVHHLSVPWRPADMVQREGRILRKGNTCEKVRIFRYITEGTFDAYSWQLLESKQRFIASFLSGTGAERQISDISDTVLSYAEVKALAIGNPLIKKRVEVSNRLERVKVASRARQKQLQELRSVIDISSRKVGEYKALAQLARDDYRFYGENKASVPNEERIAFGEELLEAVGSNVGVSTEREFDTYMGFDIVLPANMSDEYRHILVKREGGGVYLCEIDKEKTALGCSKSIDYLLEHLDGRAENFEALAFSCEKRISEAQDDMKDENPYLAVIEQLKFQLSVIDAELEENAESKKENE
ncbi:MAG: DEAD/DEAH box helicase family protein [Clostridia bacterium]|nr:DEAD/DEAH box helicase family protein [Clostridia bacterium]